MNLDIEQIEGMDLRLVVANRLTGYGPDCDPTQIPKYEDNIEDAWLVVNRMRAQKWHVAVETDMETEWLCTMWKIYEHGVETIYASEETPAMAICRAALLAEDCNDRQTTNAR